VHDLATLDFRLLTVFEALFEHRSVSRAADAMGVGQPAVSQALRRLRELLDDPLFVRSGSAMSPTALAERLREPIASILTIARAEMLAPRAFEPSTSRREFRLMATDFGAATIVPPLEARLRHAAPNVAIRVIPMEPGAFDALERTEVDLVVGIVNERRPGIHTRRLFVHDYTCLARIDHPAFRGSITAEGFGSTEHVIVTADTGSGNTIEQFLRHHVPELRVRLRVPAYAILPPLLGGSDLMAVVPRMVAETYLASHPLAHAPPPFALPQIAVIEAWHQRSEQDAGHLWLRTIVADIFTKLPVVSI
jgi:DNA-binding transcriptional LysR family regulator